MEIEIESSGWAFQRSSEAFGAARPDWQGIRARLSATQAARMALSCAKGQVSAAPGSFDPRAADTLVSFHKDLGGINRTALSYGRVNRGMDMDATGTSSGASLFGARGI